MTVRIDPAQLRALVVTIFGRCGLARDAAERAAAVVCYADEHGIATHGCRALVSIYAPRLRDGRIDPAARPVVVRRAPAGVVLDARGGLGLLAMTDAVDAAAALARATGIGLALVRGSSHFGSAGYYTHRLAGAGLVGLAMTNCGAQGVVPPLGGAVRLLGTNPLSAAVPAAARPPFVLDMSTTVVATGKLATARADGRAVPAGWLLGRDGADVTDPAAYYGGTADVAWLGGRAATGAAKGYGLALLVDLLCGPLAGASYGPHRDALNGDGPPAGDRDVGHLALAIDPAAFGSPERFAAGVHEMLDTITACPPARGHTGDAATASPGVAAGPTYPGAPEAAHEADAAERGIALAPDVASQLAQLATELGVDPPPLLRDAAAVPMPAESAQAAR
jgi:LDH2 family malate/lactate/ureidoglycolate dehydrogenase